MNTPLQLEAEDIRILIEGYQKQKIKLQEEIQSLTDQVKKLDERMHKLSKVNLSAGTPSLTQSVYQAGWTWNQKIEYFLSHSQDPLTASEIVKQIIEHEPGLERKKVMSSVSATLSLAVGKRYKKIEKDQQEMKYARLA